MPWLFSKIFASSVDFPDWEGPASIHANGCLNIKSWIEDIVYKVEMISKQKPHWLCYYISFTIAKVEANNVVFVWLAVVNMHGFGFV